MPKQVSKFHTTSTPILIAICLVLIGVVGIILAMRVQEEAIMAQPGDELQVVEGTGNYPNQDSKAGQVLQGAASVKDFQGKDNDLQQGQGNVQTGTSIEELLKDKEISQ